MEIRTSNRVRFGAFELDLRAGELQCGRARVVLQEQPLQILLMLLEARGEIVTREEIKKRLWPNDTVVEFDHGIHTAIRKLRKALDDSANAPTYIETVARRGYRLMVPVECAGDSSGDSPSGDAGDVAESAVEALSKATLNVGRLTGKVVSHYRVLEIIGGGGMGLVYRAEDLKLGRAVALKFLPEEVGDDPRVRERFEREAHAVSALNHHNICTVHDFDEHEGRPFIAMELLQGKTLRDHLANGRFRLTEAEGCDVAIQIASGLEAAHEKGIIHRDIKPANIFITEKNVVKILDFGVAKMLQLSEESENPHPTIGGLDGAPGCAVAVLPMDERGNRSHAGLIPPQDNSSPEGTPFGVPLQNHELGLESDAEAPQAEGLFHQPGALTLTGTGMKLGTAGYMSPEQVRGEKLDARTDLFSFGLVLYEMATGDRAFTGETVVAVNDAILHRTPRPVREANPKVSVGFETIISKCLKKDREERYQHASEVKAELQRQVRRAGRSRWLWAAAAAVLLTLALGIWVASRRPKVASEPKLTQLTSNFNENPVRGGAVSHDGKNLVYQDLQGLHIKSLETGETRNLSKPDELRNVLVQWDYLQWFPDGSKILALESPPLEHLTIEQHHSIWAFSTTGGAPRKLRDNAAAPNLSPSGRFIAFTTANGPLDDGTSHANREIWMMDSTGEHAHKLFEADEDVDFEDPQWFTGEQRLGYMSIDGAGVSFKTRDLRSNSSTTILTFPNNPVTRKSDVTAVLFLPNGRVIYSQWEASANDYECNLWKARVDPGTGELTEKATRLTNWTGSCIGLQNSPPDGTRAVFLKWAGEASIYVANLARAGTSLTTPRRITPGERYVPSAWTADSKDVIFTHRHNGQWGIFRQAVNEGAARPIVASFPGYPLNVGAKDRTYPRMTPDGSQILYMVVDRSGPVETRNHIMRVPVDGGESRLVMAGNFDGPPDCTRPPHTLCVIAQRSQDSTQLVFSSFDSVGGQRSEIASLGVNPKSNNQWALSPDGTRIALVDDGMPEIQVLRLNNKTTQRIHLKGWDRLDSIYWAPNSQGLYVSSLEPDGSVVLYTDLRGNAHKIWKEMGGLGTYGIPSPDGRHIALYSWTLNNNLWMMENF